MKKNKGISLIVLVITIVVIIILAGSVILSISQNNPISSANEATFKQNVKNYQSELSLYIAKEYTNPIHNGNYDPTTANILVAESIPSMKAEDKGKFEIIAGKLAYKGTNEQEKIWAGEIGLGESSIIPSENLGEGTRDKAQASYNKPYVPNEFKYLEGTVNTGYVIQDKTNENEFVWVPVDGDVLIEYNNKKNASRDSLPSNMKNGAGEEDESLIIKYGGFYIGRYEAGLPEQYISYDSTIKNWKDKDDKEMPIGTAAISKKGVKVWNNISYMSKSENSFATVIGAKDAAANMYTKEEVKSGLMTKAMWDTTCKWLEISGAKTNIEIYTDSTSWGNCMNNSDNGGIIGTGVLQVTGFSRFWNANNIYDLAGNVWEWNNSCFDNKHRFYRGLSYRDSRWQKSVNSAYGFYEIADER